MDVEVFLTPYTVSDDDVRGKTVIVIDVFRACSTIATALDAGARAVVPVPDGEEAGKMAANLDPSSYLLGGERDGIKIDGYDLGNSPLEYTQEEVEDRDVILNTTNGTGVIDRARGARRLIVGGFLNAQRVVDFVREHDDDLTIVCAGWRGRVSLEDTLCAGLILYRLWDGEEPDYCTDTAHIALTLYKNDRDHHAEALRRCNHAQRLYGQGAEADVEYCLRIDAVPVLPYYQDSRLVLLDSTPSSAAASR